ncbi:MAG: UDP-N-acetylmuramate--L-alanine ligase [Spirochaetaceae bacterium]|nr:UDP-N-acetylmuramate--L-alanine ligase [Spirochaetaceae bacterium]
MEGCFAPGKNIYMVGVKGTGMTALAELLCHGGANVSGSDLPEVFYTDAILKELNISWHESFDSAHVPPGADLVIHSAAYDREKNPELAAALAMGLKVVKYTDALGAYSEQFDSSGIAGVHGKTTTTALCGVLIRAASLPACVLAGSAVGAFGGRSTLTLGGKYFVAETCEYRKHFLSFRPRRIVLTSVESDHQDFFPTYESIRDAFVEYALLLPQGGTLIYCADDQGASETASIVLQKRKDIQAIPYGLKAGADLPPESGFVITGIETKNERTVFYLNGFDEPFVLRVPGRHTVLDAAGALALSLSLLKTEYGDAFAGAARKFLPAMRAALELFSGSRRRSEIIGEAGGILFMDDYGHHPTAIKTTLEGLREFYPARRIVLSFMSHTYSRTAALLDEFAASFDNADMVVLHKIYASAREQYRGGVNGKTLYERALERQSRGGGPEFHYAEEVLDALPLLKSNLKKGDLFITMGAGDNWKLGRALYDYFGKRDKA